jgi:hypothetical protein
MAIVHTVKAHLPVLIDYFGLAAAIALIVYASQTLGSDRVSPLFAVVYASLVIGHLLFPIPRRTPILYGVLLTIGIVSTVYYALGTFRSEFRFNSRYRPRRMRISSYHWSSPRPSSSHHPSQIRRKSIAS